MLHRHGLRREVTRLEVHRPRHVDDVEPEKAIADGLDPGLFDPGPRFCQKSVPDSEHPAEGRHDTNPYVRDFRAVLYSCWLDDLHTLDATRAGPVNVRG
jgi:hypothetical protein